MHEYFSYSACVPLCVCVCLWKLKHQDLMENSELFTFECSLSVCGEVIIVVILKAGGCLGYKMSGLCDAVA